MGIQSGQFFKQKRDWSLTKDCILGCYLKPYITKVKELQKPIAIIDGFSGPGYFADKSKGSPLIICDVIQNCNEQFGSNAFGVFIEKNKTLYKQLEKVLEMDTSCKSYPMHGRFQDLLLSITKITADIPCFFYIDPFGIKDLEFVHLEHIFRKVKIVTTEVLINFRYATLPRIANRNPMLAEAIMGGGHFRTILDNPGYSDIEKEALVIGQYMRKYDKYFDYVGSCPVFGNKRRAEYYLIFATSHEHGAMIMSDVMARCIKKQFASGRLFSSPPASISGDLDILKARILKTLKEKNGSATRGEIKSKLLISLFGQHTESDYNQVVQNLLKSKIIRSATGKTRINDSVPLFLK